jgi:hypothetical protein
MVACVQVRLINGAGPVEGGSSCGMRAARGDEAISKAMYISLASAT